MRRRALLLFGALALIGACDPAACDPAGVGCGGEPAGPSDRPAQPVTRPSAALVEIVDRPEVEVITRADPARTRRTTAVAKTTAAKPAPVVDPKPAPKKPIAVRSAPKPPPAPRLVRGVWRYATAPQFLGEYLGGKQKSRFKARLQVTGKIKRIIDLGAVGGRRLWLDGGQDRFVEARFRDNGAATTRLKPGRTVTVDCTATGRIGKNAQLTDCVLR